MAIFLAGSSSEQTMQVPPAACAFAVDPYQRVGRCSGDEIVAGDVVLVPPARFDALRAGEQGERSVAMRHGVDFGDGARRIVSGIDKLHAPIRAG